MSNGGHVYIRIFVSPSIISILGKLSVINLEKNASEYDVSQDGPVVMRSDRHEHVIWLRFSHANMFTIDM
jgi:hypothetical protein